ncbi:MAG: saccharopine dehydrogenase C-terminal domain-containing protein [Alphaproteobacteria bacterium]|nr:saccharopine dehydrogenase C-terminal domain-containing protein [Alphaproteobacteria bacterium]
MEDWETYSKLSGSVVMLGFGSIGRGMLPLLERHLDFDISRMVVIDPDSTNRSLLDERGIRFIQERVTPDNFNSLLPPLFGFDGKQGFCVNLSVDVSSFDLLKLCRGIGVFYIDTVLEPWKGFYFNRESVMAARTNYYLRESLLSEKAKVPDGVTALTCCGANPGMVSWFVKQALVNLSSAVTGDLSEPGTRSEWALLMRNLAVKGIHIAERDTQRSVLRKPLDTFWNTWSVDGFVSEGLQPAELGWGTHEKWMPDFARRHDSGCQAAIYFEQPGVSTQVRTWCPTLGSQYGFLVTHNESISISDYFTVKEDGVVVYRPTCHYAYRPCDDALLSLHELLDRGGELPPFHHVLDEKEIIEGQDELGVLLYGHQKNAYWYGSRLTIEQARSLAPYQNATALQVTSAVLAGMVWVMENPCAGIVEAEETDYKRCLELQRPYLGDVGGYYSEWTPLEGRSLLFPDNSDPNDPWQFRNVLVQR